MSVAEGAVIVVAIAAVIASFVLWRVQSHPSDRADSQPVETDSLTDDFRRTVDRPAGPGAEDEAVADGGGIGPAPSEDDR